MVIMPQGWEGGPLVLVLLHFLPKLPATMAILVVVLVLWVGLLEKSALLQTLIPFIINARRSMHTCSKH